jgi:hypothetical protein
MGEPVADLALGAALEGHFDEARITAVKAAEEMDGVGEVAAGMKPRPLDQRKEVRMASASVVRDPRELGCGNADRFLFD